MTQIDDETRVRHILQAARRARELVEGRKREDLEADDVLGLALVRLLEIVGEGARGVSPHLRARHPAVPWTEMIATRNRVIHAYYSVDMDIVWHIATSELPFLISQLEELQAIEGFQ